MEKRSPQPESWDHLVLMTGRNRKTAREKEGPTKKMKGDWRRVVPVLEDKEICEGGERN